jgi:hypothetical protein
MHAKLFFMMTALLVSLWMSAGCQSIESLQAQNTPTLMAEVAEDTASTYTPVWRPSPLPSNAPPLPCTYDHLLTWELSFYIADTTNVTLLEAELARFRERPFPECARAARSYALQAYDFAIRAARAAQMGDVAAQGMYLRDKEHAISEFENEMQRQRPESIPEAASSGIEVVCPSQSATCQQLTCAQAYACLKDGNTRLDRDRDGVPCESICGDGG